MFIRTGKNCHKGFTLVENLIALAVLGIFTVGVLSAVGYGFFVIKEARENQRATQILLEKAELVRLYNWDQVNSPNFIPPTFTADYHPKAPEGKRGVKYYGTLTVTNFPGNESYAQQMRMLTISLRWQSGASERQRTYHTYVARDGIQNYVY